MSSDRTFYINHDHLKYQKAKIESDYWKHDRCLQTGWQKMWDAVNRDEADLKFKAISIVIIWVEYREQCDVFRNLLKKYKIEFQEQM